MTETLLVAVVAGMVATVNPCGFAMLPAYLTLVVTGSADRTRAQLLARAVGSSALMTLGFVTVFGLFGVVIAPASATIRSPVSNRSSSTFTAICLKISGSLW